MSMFKEMLVADLDNVFFNQDEFAEEVVISGRTMIVIKDNELLKVYKLKHGEKLMNSELLFHVKKSYFKSIPETNKLMEFNHKKYRVLLAEDNDGVLTITLGRYQG